jgi:Immunity protein 53
MKNNLSLLQDWFYTQCDGDWEHKTAIRISTTDNPGWLLEVDIEGTVLENREFKDFSKNMESETEWMFCKVEHKKFIAACGSKKLDAILEIFLEWAKV